MQRDHVNHLKLWRFERLSGEKGVRHFVTDRLSDDRVDQFTLSLSSHPDRGHIINNRNSLAQAMEIDPDHLIFPSQVHGDRIGIVTEGTTRDDIMDTDALITLRKGLCIAVMSADCVPVLLYDRQNHIVAAVHAGWRGTVKKIVAKTMKRLSELGTQPMHLLAGIGPSVCQRSYEVGEEVINEVRSAFRNHAALLHETHSGKAQFDLWEANRSQLLDAGVPEQNIEVSDLCTVLNNDYFFSARKGDKGRFAAGIMLM